MQFNVLGQVITEGVSKVCDYGTVSTICSWRPIPNPHLRVTPRYNLVSVYIVDTWITVFATQEIQEIN